MPPRRSTPARGSRCAVQRRAGRPKGPVEAGGAVGGGEGRASACRARGRGGGFCDLQGGVRTPCAATSPAASARGGAGRAAPASPGAGGGGRDHRGGAAAVRRLRP
uniref:Uncharacterized protein n=1 Tax=Arundo donax TaxID=35708 RepID=A0A0A9E7C6_ARUDO